MSDPEAEEQTPENPEPKESLSDSDEEEQTSQEPEPKKSIFDRLSKKQWDDLVETVIFLTVCFALIFFYPLLRYYAVEFVTLSRCYYSPPAGHGKFLGGHVDPEPAGVPVKSKGDWPTPIRFYDDYVSESRPVMLRGLAAEFPAFNSWTDDYLRSRAGSEEVTVKQSGGEYNISTLSKFLERYQNKRMLLNSRVPRDLASDLFLPPLIKCGNFLRSLAEVLLWMNSGNITVGLNMEVLDTLQCSIRGSQNIVLINRLHHESANLSVTESLERRSFDLCWDRHLLRLTWINVTLHEGDCLYIPSRWYKEAFFDKVRNLGITFRFFRLLYFNQSDCETEQPNQGLPESPPGEQLLKYEVISLSENLATLDWYNFKKLYNMPGINDPQAVTKLFHLLDSDGDNEVLPEDMYSMDTKDFMSFFPGFKSNDAAGTRRPHETIPALAEEKEL